VTGPLPTQQRRTGYLCCSLGLSAGFGGVFCVCCCGVGDVTGFCSVEAFGILLIVIPFMNTQKVFHRYIAKLAIELQNTRPSAAFNYGTSSTILLVYWTPLKGGHPIISKKDQPRNLLMERGQHPAFTLPVVMLQRLAIANAHGWNRFLHTIDQVHPRRGDTLPLPLDVPDQPK
jgi:hypothetical protein